METAMEDNEQEPAYVVDWADIRHGLLMLCFVVTTAVNILCIIWYMKTPNHGIIECTASGMEAHNIDGRLNGHISESRFRYNLARICGASDL